MTSSHPHWSQYVLVIMAVIILAVLTAMAEKHRPDHVEWKGCKITPILAFSGSMVNGQRVAEDHGIYDISCPLP